MGNLIRLIILAALIYGIVWVVQNVDFNNFAQNPTQKLQNEKTITRVVGGRERAAQDAKRVSE